MDAATAAPRRRCRASSSAHPRQCVCKRARHIPRPRAPIARPPASHLDRCPQPCTAAVRNRRTHSARCARASSPCARAAAQRPTKRRHARRRPPASDEETSRGRPSACACQEARRSRPRRANASSPIDRTRAHPPGGTRLAQRRSAARLTTPPPPAPRPPAAATARCQRELCSAWWCKASNARPRARRVQCSSARSKRSCWVRRATRAAGLQPRRHCSSLERPR